MADGCFGRALPLIADADQDGRFEVYFPTAFNNPHPGLFAFDAATGNPLWKAGSVGTTVQSALASNQIGGMVTRSVTTVISGVFC